MTDKNLYLGNQKATFKKQEVKGELVEFQNEQYYKISNHDAMRPFFMSIVSDSNHWMFISSNGGLTAGRKNSDSALFPYYTDDKITESSDITGSKTIIKVYKNDRVLLWEPFSKRYNGIYSITCNLYKNVYGNKVVFEEINHDLKLTYRYHWNSSDAYGFIKKSELINNASEQVKATVLDGLQNMLPATVGEDLQKASSNLVDAYKRSELKKETGIGIIALSAVIVDKAEPSEALKANIAWSLGLNNPTYLMSSLQLENFRKGETVRQEDDIKAEKGAYFTVSEMTIEAEATKEWFFIADVNQTIVSITDISNQIKTDAHLIEKINDDIALGSEKLVKLIAASDGLQLTEDPLTNNRHFANTMFNIMRGGIFDNNYVIEKVDFINYIKKANSEVYDETKELLNELSETFNQQVLLELTNTNENPHFKRLVIEYLPLKFSRRHGDPSRPWNKFSINTRSEVDGSKILDYEGNWRDIFQNWEALAHSYPEFIEGMIHKFLNATTFDGYNPYRVTKGGFDWEVIEEDDPWSYIGYWGDHQIIYLLKFLEFIRDHYPSRLASFINEDVFVYANVPYKIKPYSDILKNPKDTIDFDYKLQEVIEERREKLGADGALLKDNSSAIYRVNLIEKLLATVLAKVSNFIPEAGIWLNTQRPEWNDANNALVGNGVSMVTLYYLRRFLNYFEEFITAANFDTTSVSEELESFFDAVNKTLEKHQEVLDGNVDNGQRRAILDGLSQPASDYREQVYDNNFSGKKENVSKQELLEFVRMTLKYLDHSIDANKRFDNMYHAYNLMTIEDNGEISVSYLSEMLEGQVAVLSSGYLTSYQALEVMDGLKASALFRPDQYSYILYPNKNLAGFEERNIIPSNLVDQSKLLQKLVANDNHQIIVKDLNGTYHFNASFNNVNSLKKALKDLDIDTYSDLIADEQKQLEKTFEAVFNHKAFTGRSGTFFGYEGLGSIYWHMVSKLLLAVQECSLKAVNEGASPVVIGKMLDHYYEIQAGIGAHKSPKLYGAVPTDPYSHTPATKGAQQPGMTGQVKEDILSRFGELGLVVSDGILHFKPSLLRDQEFLKEAKSFDYINVNQEKKSLQVAAGSLAFTYCQVPVVYTQNNKEAVKVTFVDGSETSFGNLQLDTEMSEQLFKRTNKIELIEVHLKK
ncbi:hypothetical protein LX97_02314 [Nonlabens dokdonensis]|uniref:Uncharacterized protein n=2 Tax=Nonlabens dokdonensis TaxID=328515 RepID=L7WBA5_NONDD|nr:hypothetical protein [Nonlabens dokdonensis]AGC77487.1 hypothetical protein DDD_2360 [Nonlabens dokdonensis DSW-6]PZX39954.1 hypothetical protein LX97_02314 [Nonlabens dokdonensis]